MSSCKCFPTLSKEEEEYRAELALSGTLQSVEGKMTVHSKVQLPGCQCRCRAALTTGGLVAKRRDAAVSYQPPASSTTGRLAAPLRNRRTLAFPQNRSMQLPGRSIAVTACASTRGEVSLDQEHVGGADERGIRRRESPEGQLRSGSGTGSSLLYGSSRLRKGLPVQKFESSRQSNSTARSRRQSPLPSAQCNLEQSSNGSLSSPAHISRRVHAATRRIQVQHSQLGAKLRAPCCRRSRRRWELNALPAESLAESVFTLAVQAGPTVDLQTVIISAGALISISASLYFGMKVSRAVYLYSDSRSNDCMFT